MGVDDVAQTISGASILEMHWKISGLSGQAGFRIPIAQV